MALADSSGGDNIPQWTRGDRLRKAREIRGLSQKEMAEKFDVGRTTISAWEDDVQPTKGIDLMEMLERWADYTEVDAAWLAGFRTGSNRHLSLIAGERTGDAARDGGAPPVLQLVKS
jgi:transcriptional regulator with XRE-family HTH domain